MVTFLRTLVYTRCLINDHRYYMIVAILFNCPLSNSLWMTGKHLKCNMSKMELLVPKSHPSFHGTHPQAIDLSLLYPCKRCQWSHKGLGNDLRFLFPLNPHSESKSSPVLLSDFTSNPTTFPHSSATSWVSVTITSHLYYCRSLSLVSLPPVLVSLPSVLRRAAKRSYSKWKPDQDTHLCKTL